MRFKLILLGILFLGVFLRLYHSSYYFPFGSDQEADLYAIRQIYNSIKKFEFRKLSLRGQLGTYLPENTELLKNESGVPVYSGVFYYYFLLPWGIISKFHPYGIATLFIFLGVISIYLIFDVGRKLFDDYTALLAAFFFSFSYWTISFSRTIWNASLIPFFVLLSLFAFVRILKGKIKFWPLLAFSVSAASQVHNSGYFFLIFMIVGSVYYKLRLPPKKSYLGVTLLSFSLPLIPTLITEVSTGFGNFSGMWEGLLKQLTFRYGASLGILGLISLLFKEFALFLATSTGLASQIIDPLPEYFDKPFVVLGLILASVGLFMFSKKSFFLNLFKIKKSGAFLIFLWFLFFLPIPAVASIYYHEGLLHGHSMMGLLMGLPFFYLAAAWFIRRLLLVNYLRIVAFLLLGLFLVTNSITVSNLIFRNRRSHYVRFDYGDKLEVMKFINMDSGDNPYLLNFLETEGSSFFVSGESRQGFSYIAQIEGLRPPENIGERHYIPPEDFLKINKVSRALPTYTLSEKEYEEGSELDTNGILVEEIGLYNIYKK